MFDRLGVIGLLFFIFGLSPADGSTIDDSVIEKATTVISENPIQSQETLSKEKVGKRFEDIIIHVTYYTNIDNTLQGGKNDRRGKPLTSHSMPVVAMPSDVPYGSYLDIKDHGTFKVVDTGGAIKWIDENTCKVDVFIPNVSYDWLINNTENFTTTARLYYNDN